MNKFAQRLYEIRKDKSISQLELANHMCTTQATVSRWEKNKQYPDYDNLIELCKYFECTADYLLGLTDY